MTDEHNSSNNSDHVYNILTQAIIKI